MAPREQVGRREGGDKHEVLLCTAPSGVEMGGGALLKSGREANTNLLPKAKRNRLGLKDKCNNK